MVIQRWQSVLMLLACACMVLFLFIPVGYIPAGDSPDSVTPILPLGNPILLVVSCLVALLLLINIFMFKNMKKQLMILGICMLLMGAIEASVMFITLECEFGIGSLALLTVAFILTWMARRCITRDRRKLSESDRIR